MFYIFYGLDFKISIMLIVALFFVLLYEMINGFHDTSNAIATVIYTRAMCSYYAVFMSGVCNFLGVLMGGVGVAYSIVHLLSINLLTNINSVNGLLMMFSVLLSAILWNIWTWYLGLPISSSHTLIGSIIGMCLANSFVTHNYLTQVLNINKFFGIFLSLVISPFIGFLLAWLAMLFLRCFSFLNKSMFRNINFTPIDRIKRDGKPHPPFFIRLFLILSSAGVSFFHGANDGQKGIGLIMLILICVVPSGFIVNINASSCDINRTYNAVKNLQQYCIAHQNELFDVVFFNSHKSSSSCDIADNNYLNEFYLNKKFRIFCLLNNLNLSYFQEENSSFDCLCKYLFYLFEVIDFTLLLLNDVSNYDELTLEQKCYLRFFLMYISDFINEISDFPEVSLCNRKCLFSWRFDILHTIEYAPLGIIFVVASALSLGTMIGWKRITVTIGEKIGKYHITYAQGLSSQVITAISIGTASYIGMPVSTTHVLSSALTSTMLFNYGVRSIQINVLKNIFIAWLLTFPVSICMAFLFYVCLFKIFVFFNLCLI